MEHDRDPEQNHGGDEAATRGLEEAPQGLTAEPGLSTPSAPSPVSVAASDPRGNRDAAALRVLVVDDDPDCATSLSMLMRIIGYDVRVAADGVAALDVAEEFHPEVVLLDIGMPRMDGHEAARLIRGRPWGKHTVLIATTGWNQEADQRESREAGFDHHLVKPLDPIALIQLLASLDVPSRSDETSV